jgi:hypothetical protein
VSTGPLRFAVSHYVSLPRLMDLSMLHYFIAAWQFTMVDSQGYVTALRILNRRLMKNLIGPDGLDIYFITATVTSRAL